jgi:hypothetical protein
MVVTPARWNRALARVGQELLGTEGAPGAIAPLHLWGWPSRPGSGCAQVERLGDVRQRSVERCWSLLALEFGSLEAAIRHACRHLLDEAQPPDCCETSTS